MASHSGAFTALACVAGVLAILAGSGLVSSAKDDVAEKARLKKLDAGQSKIDVSKYPDEMKKSYPLLEKKCVKCHSLARVINTSYVLPAEWERYVKRMMYKPDSKLTDADAKAIYKFLVYDTSVRKADSLRVHLARLTNEERETALGKVKVVNPTFSVK